MLQGHVLVLLSDYEGLPIALMEAMACGLVPICRQMRSGIPELVEDGITGLMVSDRGDAFVAAVRRLRDSLELWEKLSTAARALIEAEYSHEVCAAKWEAFLKELHKSARQRQPIIIPRRFQLPPIHPGLGREDNRKPTKPALPKLLLLWLKRRAGKVKRWLIGVFSAQTLSL